MKRNGPARDSEIPPPPPRRRRPVRSSDRPPPLPCTRRKPLSAYNGAGAPKSAFKTPKLPGAAARGRVSFAGGPAGARRVSFLARDVDAADAASAPADPKTPAAATVARVTHRRARMRTRKGTGRSVAARTFSLVLKTLPEPEPEPDARAADDDAVPPAMDASSGSLSGVAAGSAGASGSVGGSHASLASGDSVDDEKMRSRLDALGEVTTRRKGGSRTSFGDDATTAEEGASGHLPNASSMMPPPPPVDINMAHDDDDDGDFGGGGFDDGYDGEDQTGAWGSLATPGATTFLRGDLVEGGNHPMTGGLDWPGANGRRVKRPRAHLGPRRPAGTPHKLERARMEKRKSLAHAGSRHDLEDEDGRALRRSQRQRTRPLEYWRGETKHYVRVHASLPTVETMTHRTPNPAWPRKTPAHAHGGGAIIAVGGVVPADSELASRRAGEEARRRALRLADVAHLSDSELEEDAEEGPEEEPEEEPEEAAVENPERVEEEDAAEEEEDAAEEKEEDAAEEEEEDAAEKEKEEEEEEVDDDAETLDVSGELDAAEAEEVTQEVKMDDATEEVPNLQSLPAADAGENEEGREEREDVDASAAEDAKPEEERAPANEQGGGAAGEDPAE